jgi:hypothetical protein
MHKPNQQQATLPHPSGAQMPHITLPIEARYQFAVNCGAQSATVFFDEDQAITLHAHLPASLGYFLRQSRLGAAVLGVDFSESAKACTDAFVAGYLMRLQQELRIMRPTQQQAVNPSNATINRGDRDYDYH